MQINTPDELTALRRKFEREFDREGGQQDVAEYSLQICDAYAELRKTNAQTQEAIIKWIEANAAATTLINEQESKVKRLRAALESVEWIADHDGVRWCPSCWACHPEHVSTCRLKAALDATGGTE